MPFLSSIFRKDKDKDGPSSPSHSTFSRARSRPSIASSRECISPPPQLADISPQSDLSYVLPELEELQASGIVQQLDSKEPPAESVSSKKRGIGFGRRRESTNSALVISSPTSATSPPRPFSDMDIDRPTPMTTTNHNKLDPNLHSDSDDDPLVPPPPRASVFAGYSYSDQDRPRAQSVPEERERPPRPQIHPHQSPHSMAKGKLKKDGSSTRSGLFSWRTKSAKEVPTTINTDSSFSLKSFRHVGPPSPVVRPSESTASLPVVGGTSNGTFSRSTSTGSPAVPSPTTAGTSSTSTARPTPGRSTPTTRERVNSTSSEGVMTAGLFRQAARRSSTNLVEEAAEPIRSRMRDLDKRGPPTARAWTDDTSSGSDRATSGPRKSAPDTSSRKTTLENKPQPRKSTPAPNSGRNKPGPGPPPLRKSLADSDEEPTSPFAGRLGESGRTSPFATRSESGHGPRDLSHIPRMDYSMYGARSDGGIRGGSKLASSTTLATQSKVNSPSSPTKSILSSHTLTTSPGTLPVNLPSIAGTAKPGPKGYASSRSTSPTKPRPSSPVKRTTPPSPTKPRLSAPTATRPPIRTTIPTKTNDGPSIKPGSGERRHKRQGSGSSQASSGQSGYQGLGHGRRPSASGSARSVSVDVLSHSRQVSTDTLGQIRGGDAFSHARQQSADTISQQHARRPSVEVLSHTRRPSGFEVVSRPKSPGPTAAVEPRPVQQTKTTDQLRQEAIEAMRGGAKSPAPSFASRLNEALGPSQVSSWASDTQAAFRVHDAQPSSESYDTQLSHTKPSSRAQDAQATPRKNYVPPPRQSSLAAGALVDSDSDESPEEVESESEGLGFGKPGGVGAMRGRHGNNKDTRPGIGNGLAGSPPGRVNRSAANSTKPSNTGRSPRSQTQHSRSNSDDQPGLTRERTITQRDAPPKVGVSLFDSPVSPRARASHSTSAISAAATAKNSAALADANRTSVSPPESSRANALPEINRANVTTTRPGTKKHARAPSFGTGSVSHVRAPATGTDTDEDEEESSEESSEDDAPLSSLAPAKRPGSAASTAASVRPGPGPRPSAPQSRPTAPLINIPGVTAAPPRPPRINRVPGVGVTRNSSLRGSRSVEDLGRKPVGPSRPGPRPFITSPPSSTGDSSSGKAPLTPRDGSEAGRGRSDEARRKERRRSEAKKSVELGNVINGPGPFPDDQDEDAISMGHSQMGHAMGMMGMGWNQSGFFPPGGAAFGGAPGFPTSQSMPFLHPQMTGPHMPLPFMPPPPPPGANDTYLQAHQQAMMIAKQTYLQAVAQQAMVAATEQWERSSNMGGSVYGGSQSSMGMGMMGMPMMGMYAGSSYAASAYEGSVAGWGSASAYGGPSGPRSVYGGGARSEFGGGIKTKPTGQNRPRGKTQTGGSDAQPTRRDPVPPSTWATRRKAGM